MKTVKFEINIGDDEYNKLSEGDQHEWESGIFASKIVKCFLSIMLKETSFYKFEKVCIMDEEYYHEVMKREFNLDKKIDREHKIFRDKLLKINEILKS